MWKVQSRISIVFKLQGDKGTNGMEIEKKSCKKNIFGEALSYDSQLIPSERVI